MNKRNLWLLALCFLVMTTIIFSAVVGAETPTPSPVMYTLTVTPLVNGPATIDVTPPGVSIRTKTSFSYPAGTAVTLKANNYYYPSGVCYIFYQWLGDITGKVNPVTITMYKNMSVNVNYITGDPTPTPRPATPTPRRQMVTPTPTLSVIATPTPTSRRILPTPTLRGGYYVTTVIQSDWGTGATVSVTIQNNTSESIPAGSQFVFYIPSGATIGQLWGSPYVQEGNKITLTLPVSIAANGGTFNFGFNINYSSRPPGSIVYSASLNGIPCTIR